MQVWTHLKILKIKKDFPEKECLIANQVGLTLG